MLSARLPVLVVVIPLLLPGIVTCSPLLTLLDQRYHHQDKRQAGGAEITITGWAGINTAEGQSYEPPASVTAFIPYTGSSYSGGPNTTIYAYYEVTLTASEESATVTETYNATNILVVGPTAVSQAIYHKNSEDHTVANYNNCSVNASNVGVCQVQVVVGEYTIPAADYTTQGGLIQYPATPTSIAIPSNVTDVIGLAQLMASTAVSSSTSPESVGPLGGAAALSASASSQTGLGQRSAVATAAGLALCGLLGVYLV